MMVSQLKYWISILKKKHGIFGVYMFYITHILMIFFIILGIILEVKK